VARAGAPARPGRGRSHHLGELGAVDRRGRAGKRHLGRLRTRARRDRGLRRREPHHEPAHAQRGRAHARDRHGRELGLLEVGRHGLSGVSRGAARQAAGGEGRPVHPRAGARERAVRGRLSGRDREGREVLGYAFSVPAGS
jgi:hypothetical protein